MILNANALAIPLADQSVQCVVTSPPYYGLRDYGTAKWEGGDPECEHKMGAFQSTKTTLHPGTSQNDKRNFDGMPYKDVCGKCGAIRIDAQIGLEQTPDEYIANLVEVFRECKRILRDDGTMWVNIGDSYSGSGNGSGDYREDGASLSKSNNKYGSHKPGTPNGLKPKDLIGIPWMLAFALRADGWYLRQDIIWAKPNPMPESVKDRCTKSHEYIFLLSKSAKYYYDNDAVREPLAASTLNDIRIDCMSGRPNKKAHELVKNGTHGSGGIGDPTKKRSELINLAGRNKRDVWTVTTKPYKGAHYATFNPELIKPCILAGAPEGGIVFDPFVGSGTTVATAIQLGRKGIGLDLSLTYLYENAKDRIEAEMLPLLTLIEQE
jgi:DNA modification methylase